MLATHVIRSIIGILSLGIGFVAVSRCIVLWGPWRWGPISIAAYSYAMAASMLVRYNQPVNQATVYNGAATIVGLVYCGTVFWAWRHPKEDPAQRAEIRPKVRQKV